ncbi:MAG: uncharacterized protein JWN14_1897, partial [Chthonomonadales bacterium]|nr:uncharacterized protein [Chthonomonadales bacterium]
LLLKQTAEAADRGLTLQFGERNSLVNLGDFRSVIYRHDDGAELMLSLDWDQKESFAVTNPQQSGEPVVESEKLGFTAHVRGENGLGGALRPTVTEMAYRVHHAAFGMRRNETRNVYRLFHEQTDFQFVQAPGRGPSLPAPIKCYGFPDQVRAQYQNASFLSDLELAFEEQLRQIYYLGPLRANPERTYTWSGVQPSDMGRTGEQAIHAILASRDKGEKISRGKGQGRVTLEEYVAEWLQKLGLIAEFRVEAVAEGSQIFQVKVRKVTGGTESLITDVGFGVSQILPVIVLCFYVPEGSTVILEQPEIHLHPAVQANLADVLIDAQRLRKVQIIIESHSEYLLRRLQRRIAEEELNKDDVALYFCEADKTGSKLKPLDLDPFGKIINWPEDFFGDEFGEIAATQKAILRRMQQAAS